jgi:hypothetical protein
VCGGHLAALLGALAQADIMPALLLVPEQFVRFLQFVKLVQYGRFAVRLPVRVVLLRQRPVGGLDDV